MEEDPKESHNEELVESDEETYQGASDGAQAESDEDQREELCKNVMKVMRVEFHEKSNGEAGGETNDNEVALVDTTEDPIACTSSERIPTGQQRVTLSKKGPKTAEQSARRQIDVRLKKKAEEEGAYFHCYLCDKR